MALFRSEQEYQEYLARRANPIDRHKPSKGDRKIPEAVLLAHVREHAAKNGWLVYHTYDSRRSEPGFPDIVAVRPNVVLFSELKTETGKLTGDQVAWSSLLSRAARVDYRLWRPSNNDEIARYFYSET